MGIKLPILRSTDIRGEILSPGEKIEISPPPSPLLGSPLLTAAVTCPLFKNLLQLSGRKDGLLSVHQSRLKDTVWSVQVI